MSSPGTEGVFTNSFSRWSNMDYIYCSTTADIGGLDVLLSYDIACQYGIHIEERRSKLPDHMQAKQDEGTRTYALPVWHGDVHALKCKTSWSLHLQPGTAKTDGEAPERVWSIMNGMANDTKEMDAGNHHDHIEDRCDKHNFTKNMSLGMFASSSDAMLLLTFSLREAPRTSTRNCACGKACPEQRL